MWIRVATDNSAVHSEGGYTYVSRENSEEYYFSEEVAAMLDQDNFLQEMWDRFDALFDWGDCDYFRADKCGRLADWLKNRLKKDLPDQVKEVYQVMLDYCQKAIDARTGIDFDF